MTTRPIVSVFAVLMAKIFHSRNARRLSRLLALSLVAVALLARAGEEDDAYLQIMALMDSADDLAQGKEPAAAIPKYRQANAALLKIKKENPAWNPKLISLRLAYLTEKITTLTKPAAPPEEPAKPPAVLTPSTNLPFKLLEAGAEPRVALRMKSKPGDKQSVVMTMEQSMSIEAAGVPAQQVNIPAFQFTLALTTKNVSPEGDIDFEIVFEEAGVAGTAAGAIAEAAKTSLAGLKGLTMLATISDRGATRKIEAKIPAGASPDVRKIAEEMKNSFANDEFGLPPEPVGKGAKWEVKARAKSNGAMVNRISTYELVAAEGDVLTIRSSTKKSAAGQSIDNSFMPGAPTELVKLAGTGTDDSTIDLAKIFPVQSKSQADEEQVLSMTIVGQKQTMTMKVRSSTQMETK